MAIAYGREPDATALRAAFERRRDALEKARRRVVARRERAEQEGLTATTIATLRHAEHRIAAELTWLAELDVDVLAAVPAAERALNGDRAAGNSDAGEGVGGS